MEDLLEEVAFAQIPVKSKGVVHEGTNSQGKCPKTETCLAHLGSNKVNVIGM